MVDGQKKGISLCILESEKEYLFIRRGKKKTSIEDWNDQYIPIGGKIEPYETPEEAVIREVKEETGFEIDNPILFGILTETSPLPQFNNIIYFFSKKIIKRQPIDCDEGYIEWVKKSNILNIPTPEIDRTIYEYLVNKQKFIINASYDDKLNLLTAYEYIENKVIK